MRGAALIRVLLAVVIVAAGVDAAHAQRCSLQDVECRFRRTEGPPPTLPSPDSGKAVGAYIVGAIVTAIIAAVIQRQLSPDQGTSGQSSPPGGQPPSAAPGAAPPAAPPSAPGPSIAALRSGCTVPPVGETRFVSNEMIMDMPADAASAIASRHPVTLVESTTLQLTGRTLSRWRIEDGTPPAAMIRTICGSEPARLVARAQVNFVYIPAQQGTVPINAEQYAPQKLELPEAHRLATGNRVPIAVIDSEVDASHPDLAGAITANFEASADAERPHPHGTGMAGAIAARRSMLGAAPGSGLLTVRAFSTRANTVEGTTFNILKGLDWAAEHGARVVNMSFAGPSDPGLRDALQKAYRKGVVLIAAAGNAGPNSPPQYPAADPNVIAVTATDANDRLFRGANRGNYIAVAAPGVDILAPAPDGTYQLTTGTSVAAAEVSGIAALLIERNPSLTPSAVRKTLMDTAKDLGPKGRDRDYGAGLVNALQAVEAVKPQ